MPRSTSRPPTSASPGTPPPEPGTPASSFHYLEPNKTRVMLQLEYEPEGLVENVGSALGVVERRVAGDLERFKEFIEARGAETGAWRGEIHGSQVDRGATR